jgi:HD superfamily phosphodiesterase
MCSEEGFDEDAIMKEIELMYEGADCAHDLNHIIRVYRSARIIGEEEGAKYAGASPLGPPA